MSGLRGRLLKLGRSLGPRRIAALATAFLAAVTVAVIALAGGPPKSVHAPLAVQAARPSTTPTGTVTNPAAHRHRSHATKRPAHSKAAIRHAHKRSTHPAKHPPVKKHNHASRSTTTTTTSTTSTATTSPRSSGPASVSFIVHGGGNASVLACGDMHHFRTYSAGASLSFSGTVRPVPGGQWKVKLHIKICQGGAYQDFAKLDAHENHTTGAFHGSFKAPQPGLYEVRAVLYLGTSESTESDKVHVETR
jgi:hypothetical protein